MLEAVLHGRSGATATKPQTSDDEPRGIVPESDAPSSGWFRAARVLYGGVLAFMALDNLRNLDARIEYARSNGAPLPDVAVPAISGALFGGSLGIALWRLPALSAAAVASFFVSVTPVMHDFWTLEGEERSGQRIHFLKNAALLGAALAFLGVALD